MTPLMKFLRANVLELSYLTEKRTLIRDWRLALLYYALLGLVTAYVVTSLVNGKSYIMARKCPLGWRRHGGAAGRVLQVAKGMEYCLRAVYEYGSGSETGKYMFNYSASYVYNNLDYPDISILLARR